MSYSYFDDGEYLINAVEQETFFDEHQGYLLGYDVFYYFEAIELGVTETNSIQYVSNTSSVEYNSDSNSTKYLTGQ